MYRIIAVVILAVTTLTVAGRCYRNSQSEWEARVSRIESQLEVEREATEAAKQEAEEAQARGDSLAAELRTQAPEIRTRIIEVQAETPDSLRNEPAILWRDSLIADLREESDGWRQAYEAQREANVHLNRALEIAVASRNSLAAVLADRPGERPWYLPRIVVGPYVGMSASMQPNMGPVAATLGWEIRL